MEETLSVNLRNQIFEFAIAQICEEVKSLEDNRDTRVEESIEAAILNSDSQNQLTDSQASSDEDLFILLLDKFQQVWHD